MDLITEINIDGMIGPTHHFGGLGVGNIASHANQHRTSNPREAALEGLRKMEAIASSGVPQFVLPPPIRPNWYMLEAFGFRGSRADILRRCGDQFPSLLSAAFSSAFMWTANAATCAPACDSRDNQLHVLPANLCSNIHRSCEADERRNQLSQLLRDVPNVSVHPQLPPSLALRDEGAANHMRLCGSTDRKARDLAVHLFVYGPDTHGDSSQPTRRFPSRQTQLTSRLTAIALDLPPENCVFIEQSTKAIDAGVFHNDVIATSNENLLLYHEDAFHNSDSTIDTIKKLYLSTTGEPLIAIRVSNTELELHEAVTGYLFNSQLITQRNGRMKLIAPKHCEASQKIRNLIDSWIQNHEVPIDDVIYMPLNQSMSNGGGPACLRLRMDLSAQQLSMLPTPYRITPKRIEELSECVVAWYPESVTMNDLLEPAFAEHAEQATIALLSLFSGA